MVMAGKQASDAVPRRIADVGSGVVTRPRSTSTLDPCTSPWTRTGSSAANNASRSWTQPATSASRHASRPGSRRAASTRWSAVPTTGGWNAGHGLPASASASQGGSRPAGTGTRCSARSAEPRLSVIAWRVYESAVGHTSYKVRPGTRSETHHGPSGPSPWASCRACGTSLPASSSVTVASWRNESRNRPLLSRTTYSSPTHTRLTQPALGRKRPAAGRPAAASVLSGAGSAAGSSTNGGDRPHTRQPSHTYQEGIEDPSADHLRGAPKRGRHRQGNARAVAVMSSQDSRSGSNFSINDR